MRAGRRPADVLACIAGIGAGVARQDRQLVAVLVSPVRDGGLDPGVGWVVGRGVCRLGTVLGWSWCGVDDGTMLGLAARGLCSVWLWLVVA